MRNIKILLLTVTALAYTLCISAANETYDQWDGTTTAVDISNTNITINTAAQLAYLTTQNNDYSGKTITLNTNIDLNDKRWTPIGTAGKPFKGTFKGNGHLIRGLRMFNATDGIGIFGHVGAEGKIEQIGISGGKIIAAGRRHIGTLAGTCAGTITQCWSMAEIVTAGDVVGGLVGELSAGGSITDCYNSGLILNAGDSVGGIVGYNNGGRLERVYHTGYAKNGKAIAGADNGGSYNNVYYDRKLYYQQSGATGITAMDVTANMYTIFSGNTTWTTDATNQRYPRLTLFANTDAALLSVAPMFIEKSSTSPVNHANEITWDFRVNIVGGVTWKCQNVADEEYIRINSGYVTVLRPCSEADILVDSKLRDEVRVVYLRVRRWDDFNPGTFNGEKKDFCFNEEAKVSDNVSSSPAKYGYKNGPYKYLVELSEVQHPGDTIAIDTLYNSEKTSESFDNWVSSNIPTSRPGTFVLRRFAHDSACIVDWVRCKGQFVYRVFAEFDGGKIESGKDTLILNTSPVTVTVGSVRDASGGGGSITYTWQSNGSDLSGTDAPSLSYDISEAGTYTFTRIALDSAQCGENDKTAEGSYTYVVFDPFNSGAVNEETDKKFCSVEDALAYTVTATAATGGSGAYHYRWYMSDGGVTSVISGATGQNLPLNLLSLEAGKDYVFTREAEDDTRFTSWATSQGEQKIYIMKVLSPGAIRDGALGKECVAHDASGSSTLTVTIPETSASTGEVDREYRWVRQPDGAVVGTSASLNYTFPISEISLGNTYTYTREVRNPGCDWQQSDGTATQYYGRSTHAEQTITICDEELPYTMTWYSANGSRFTHTFNSATDTWLVSDDNFECPADTLFRIHTVEMPDFKIEESANLCQSTNMITIYFEQTAGLSNTFHITYSPDLARYMGANDTTGTITAPGTIVIENVPSIGTGDIYFLVQIGYSEDNYKGLCFSPVHKMSLNVSLGGYVYSKYDRVLFVDNNPDNDIDVGTSKKLKFKAYQWYKNGVAQQGQTGQYYHEEGNQLNGIYYVLLTDTDGRQYRSCEMVMPVEVTAPAPSNAIYPVPVNAGQPLTINGEGSVQIVSFLGECVKRLNVNRQATVSAPNIPGMYYVQIVNADGTMEMHKLIVK